MATATEATQVAPLSAETPEPQEPESRYCKECKLAFTGGDQEKLLCSSCKNLRTKLWRRLGAWDTFKQLDAKDRELFFKKNAGTSDWPTIQSRLVETLTRVRVSESRSETGGSYLPASVLLTQGFTQDVIDACSDTEDNPALGGTTYRLRVHSEYSTEVERTVREEVLNRVKQVTTGKKTPKDWDVQRPEKAGKNDQGKEEDKAEKQKAKVAKAALALARSALPQVSAAWCSLQTAVTGAGLPAELNQETKSTVLELLRKLQEWKQACEQALGNKENCQDLPLLPFRKDEVKPACKAAAEQLKAVKLCRAEAAKLKREAKAAEKSKRTEAPAGEPKPKRTRVAAKSGA